MGKKTILVALAAVLLVCGVAHAGPVYLLAEVTVKDPALYAKYAERVPAVIAKYGGRYLVRGGKAEPVAGGWQPERIILIEFESAEQLRRCFSSPEYLEIKPWRDGSTVSKAVMLEGVQEGR
jgi:uncharacterized protein (DUF1330 family)